MSDEQAAREQAVTDQVLASLEQTPSPRTRELLEALVRHSHALVRECKTSS